MSWDVLLLKTKIDLSVKDSVPESMGEKSKIIQEMLTMQPDIDFSDTTWGIYADDGASIEINIGNKEDLQCITLHIRGGGNPHGFIARICNRFSWHAVDCSTGEYMDLENLSTESWERWMKYRDKIIKGQA